MAPTLATMFTIHYLIYFVGNRSFLRLSNRVLFGKASGNFTAGPMAYLDKRCTGKSLFHFMPKAALWAANSQYAMVSDKFPDRPLTTVYTGGDEEHRGRLIAMRPRKGAGLEPGYFLLRPLVNGGYNIVDPKTGNILASTGGRTVEFIRNVRLRNRKSRIAAEFKLQRTTKRNLKKMICNQKRRKRPHQQSWLQGTIKA